ncbi:MAG: spore maturation protein [bacterium]|nr:spore maturation protein [bacterium]
MERLDFISQLFIPLFVAFVVFYAFVKKINVYNSFINGAKDGFTISLRILPYIVAIVVAARCFYNSGALDFFKPLVKLIGVPFEIFGVAFFKPFSHSASIAFFTEVIKNYGPDSLITRMAATILGSAETTFYVIAVYCGSIGLKKLRYLVPVCVISDILGVFIAILVVNFFAFIIFY